MKRTLISAIVVAGLAAGGAAVATAGPGGSPRPGPLKLAGPGGPMGAHAPERQAELARELAGQLNGKVTAREVEDALERVHEKRTAQRRSELARELSERLDGVSVAQAEAALKAAHGQRDGPPNPADRQAFLGTLARELGKPEGEVREALQAAHRERLDARLDEAVRSGRLTREQADRIRQRGDRLGAGQGPGHQGAGRPG